MLFKREMFSCVADVEEGADTKYQFIDAHVLAVARNRWFVYDYFGPLGLRVLDLRLPCLCDFRFQSFLNSLTHVGHKPRMERVIHKF
jgi:hypothetical protein